MKSEPFPQIGTVRQADARLGNQIILHLHNHRLLSFQRQFIGNLASRQASADHRHHVSDFGSV